MNKKHKLLHRNNEYITSNLEIIYEEDIKKLVEERNNLENQIKEAIVILEKLFPICIMPNNMLIHGTEIAKIIKEALEKLKEYDES